MKTKWREIIIVIVALLLISLVITSFSAWDNTKPADVDAVYTWPASIRDNWDALEVVFGVDLGDIAGSIDFNDVDVDNLTVKISPWVDVTHPDYGAVGDGTIDDTAAIQAAIDAANAAGGGTVLLPVGNYKTTSTLTMYRGVNLIGVSAEDVVITPATDTFAVITTGNAALFTISDFKINFGVATGNAASVDTAAIGFKLGSDVSAFGNTFTIKNIFIQYCYRGVEDTSPAWNYELDRITVLNAGNYGFYINVDTAKALVSIKHCGVGGFPNGGYFLRNINLLNLSNSYCDGSTSNLPFYFEACIGVVNSCDSENNTIAGNAIYRMVGSDLTLNNCGSYSDVLDTVEANVFLNSDGGHIVLNGCENKSTTHTNTGTYAVVKGDTGTYTQTNADRFSAISGAGGNEFIYYGIVESNLDEIGTLPVNDVTPSLSGNRCWKTANTSGTTYTDLDDMVPGVMKTIIINDGNTTFDFTGTALKGNGGVDWSPASGDWLTAVSDGTDVWCGVHDTTP